MKTEEEEKRDDEKYKAYDEAVKHGPPLQEVMMTPGTRRLEEKLEKYHDVSPVLTGGDIDADWEDADSTGEEAVGGTVATPDQDIVDEIGRAVGMEFQDNQPLRTHDEVFADRDKNRWELDRRSADSDITQAEE